MICHILAASIPPESDCASGPFAHTSFCAPARRADGCGRLPPPLRGEDGQLLKSLEFSLFSKNISPKFRTGRICKKSPFVFRQPFGCVLNICKRKSPAHFWTEMVNTSPCRRTQKGTKFFVRNFCIAIIWFITKNRIRVSLANVVSAISGTIISQIFINCISPKFLDETVRRNFYVAHNFVCVSVTCRNPRLDVIGFDYAPKLA